MRLLGPDVLLATHHIPTREIVQEWVAFQQERGEAFNSQDAVLLEVAAEIHDWGEIKIDGEGVGDVSFDQKTGAHEVIEGGIFERVCAELPASPGLTLIRKAYYEVARSSEGLGAVFNAVERVGYLRTALRAFQGFYGERIQQWQGLVGNVLSNQTAKLIEYARHYPYVRAQLNESREVITKAFQALEDQPVPFDREGNLAFDHQRLIAAQTAWEAHVHPGMPE